MAKTESFMHSSALSSGLLRDRQKKGMLSARDKILLGCDAEFVNAEDLQSELDEQDLWAFHSDHHYQHQHHHQQQPKREGGPYSKRSSESNPSPGYGLASLSPLISNINIPQHNHHVVSSNKILMRQQSAPVNVPDWSKILGSSAKESNAGNGSGFLDFEDDDDQESYEQRLPPHEVVARDYARSHVMFSVHEGAGHTLKGRDLSRVRNAVLKQTGFL